MTAGQFYSLDEDERAFWIAEWEIEAEKCHECGRPTSECSDPKRRFYPFRTVCYATMEREAAVEAFKALHEDAPYHDGSFANWSNERSASHPYHYLEGVKFGVGDSDLAPEDRFTTDRCARPPGSVAVGGDEHDPGEGDPEH